MIVMLIACRKKEELRLLQQCSRDCAAYEGEEKWEYYLMSREQELDEFISHPPNLDMACIDLEFAEGTEKAAAIRNQNKTAYLILLADPERSPLTYLRPEIMAGSLLFHPVSSSEAQRVLKEAMREYLGRFREEDRDAFSVDTREGRWKIPKNKIQYFEAREKKVFLHMEEREIAFYDTMDHIQEELEGKFLRCHRSFLVNTGWIEKVRLGQNLLFLEGGIEIPVSRSFRQTVKEYLE